ncbi:MULTISPECIES: hypothetical protein [Treponema]|nr:hypothetical protein [Treponema denticola]EMB37760.1 hypothetical protein HMPREF9735_01354 [Treponema denticola ATCC 33521]EMB40386.1 hypothetical protein HMPREF9721_00480 [Treponema denticola ATCC 35404]
MENGKNLYHLLEMDDLMNVVGGDTTINTRGIDVCNPSPEPDYIIDDDGNHHHAPSPSPTNPKPAPGTGNPGNPPNTGNDGDGGGDSKDPTEDTPSDPGNPVNDDGGNGSSGGTPDNGDDETGGNTNLPTDDDGDIGNGSVGNGGQTTTPPAANINTTQTTQAADVSPKPVSPAERARSILANLTNPIEQTVNAKTGCKNDMLAAYYDDKLTNKKLSFDASYKEVQDDLPMQKDKNGKVIYPNTCKYNSTIGAVRLSGYTYKDDLTKEDVEKITNKAVSSKKCKLHTDVIKEVFGLDAVYYEIPAGLSEKELKALVGDNPAMIRFPQRAFWGNDKLPEDGEHGIGYVNGGFIEPYMGRHGESWKDVRGARSTADFTSNLGGLYFEIKK